MKDDLDDIPMAYLLYVLLVIVVIVAAAATRLLPDRSGSESTRSICSPFSQTKIPGVHHL
jgi:hypothetical protein